MSLAETAGFALLGLGATEAAGVTNVTSIGSSGQQQPAGGGRRPIVNVPDGPDVRGLLEAVAASQPDVAGIVEASRTEQPDVAGVAEAVAAAVQSAGDQSPSGLSPDAVERMLDDQRERYEQAVADAEQQARDTVEDAKDTATPDAPNLFGNFIPRGNWIPEDFDVQQAAEEAGDTTGRSVGGFIFSGLRGFQERIDTGSENLVIQSFGGDPKTQTAEERGKEIAGDINQTVFGQRTDPLKDDTTELEWIQNVTGLKPEEKKLRKQVQGVR